MTEHSRWSDFSMAKAEEVARETILDWAGEAWPIYPLDDDEFPIRLDIGCVLHWQGINSVAIVSCSRLPQEDEVCDDALITAFEIEAKVSRWESGNPIEEEDGEFTDLETVRVFVAFDDEGYGVIDVEA